MILIKINILTTMLVVLAAVVSVCVCGGGGGCCVVWGVLLFASALKPVGARKIDNTLAGNTINGNYVFVYDTTMLEINLFLLVALWQITHT